MLQRQYGGLELRVSDPVLDTFANFEDDTYDRKIAEDTHKSLFPQIQTLYDHVVDRKFKSLTSGELEPLRQGVKQQLEYLDSHPVSAALMTSCSKPDDYLAHHATNVFYLSVLLASAVREYVANERLRHTSSKNVHRSTALDLLPLGLGVVCMDLGMLALKRLIVKKEPLTEEERDQIRDHPTASANLLPDLFSPTARMIVRTHHENCDGSGYPLGQPYDKLHVFTRIVRITDAFTAATSTRVYRQARSPAEALWEMASGSYNRYYDPLLMRVFLSLVQPFPIGAKLRLTDGRYAVVTAYNRVNPFEPRVIVAFDDQGQRLAHGQLQGPLNLDAASGLRLSTFRGEDMSFLYQPLGDSPAVGSENGSRFERVFDAVYP